MAIILDISLSILSTTFFLYSEVCTEFKCAYYESYQASSINFQYRRGSVYLHHNTHSEIRGVSIDNVSIVHTLIKLLSLYFLTMLLDEHV